MSVQVRRRLRSGRTLGVAGLVVLSCYTVIALFGPFLIDADPNASEPARALESPSSVSPFGRDELGRDQLARVVDALDVALVVGLASVAVGGVVGTLLGLAAGFVGGALDSVLSWLFEVLFGIPALLLAIVLAAVVGAGMPGAILAISLVFVPRFGRQARSAAMAIAQMPYVEAAFLSGVGSFRIVWRHILRNAASPLIVLGALHLSVALLTYAALSFLGLGIPPPQADLGGMLSRSRNIMSIAPHLVVFPALVLVILIVASNLVGEWVRQKLDPRSSVGESSRLA